MLSRRKSTLGRISLRALSLCALASSALTPAYAQVVSSGPATSVVTSPKGAAVVNIATPNSQGVSHNVFKQFDVQAQGVVLNNNVKSGTSLLGGTIKGNANIKTKPATLIVNEVVNSKAASQINGGIEVYGQRAAVVIANPNGVNCDGCSFVNVSRATIAAAKPGYVSGKLSTLTTGNGGVAIGTKGVNASAADVLEIIGRTVEVNGRVSAKELILSAGNHAYDYVGKKATAVQGREEITAYSIAALTGSLSAANIRLISTGNGLGVNLVGKVTSAKDVVIQSDGNVNLAETTAARNISVSTKGALATSKVLKASGSVSLNGNKVDVGSGVISLLNTSIKSTTSLNVASNGAQSGLRAGAAYFGQTATTPSKITLTAGGTIDVGSASIFGDSIVANGQIFKQAAAGMLKADTVAVTARESIMAAGAIGAAASATLKAINVNYAGALNAGNLGISASDLVLTGTVTSNSATIAGNTVFLGGKIFTSESLAVSNLDFGGKLFNMGEIVSAGSVSLTNGGAVTLEGRVAVGRDLLVRGETIALYGAIDANNSLGDRVEFNSDGTLSQNAPSYINANSSVVLNSRGFVGVNGLIDSRSSVDLIGRGVSVRESSKILSKGSISLSGNEYVWSVGALSAAGDLNLQSTGPDGEIEISGRQLDVGGKFFVDATNTFHNNVENINAGHVHIVAEELIHGTGSINSSGAVSLYSRSIDPSAIYNNKGITIFGDILSSSDIFINSSNGDLYQERYTHVSGNSVMMTGDMVFIDGMVQAKSYTEIFTSKGLYIGRDSVLEVYSSGNYLALNSPLIQNTGHLNAPTINVPASSIFSNEGTIKGYLVRN